MPNDFTDLKEPWQRVRWARMHWFASSGAIDNTAKRAAESLGMSPSTYGQYERSPDSSRSAELTIEHAKRFGRKFKVSWLWLLTGQGTPFDEPKSEPILRLENRIRTLTDEEAERAAILIEAAFPRQANG